MSSMSKKQQTLDERPSSDAIVRVSKQPGKTDETRQSLDQFIIESSQYVQYITLQYSRIASLLTEAMLVVEIDKERAYQLCELAMDIEYGSTTCCDSSARVVEALLGDWEPASVKNRSRRG